MTAKERTLSARLLASVRGRQAKRMKEAAMPATALALHAEGAPAVECFSVPRLWHWPQCKVLPELKSGGGGGGGESQLRIRCLRPRAALDSCRRPALPPVPQHFRSVHTVAQELRLTLGHCFVPPSDDDSEEDDWFNEYSCELGLFGDNDMTQNSKGAGGATTAASNARPPPPLRQELERGRQKKTTMSVVLKDRVPRFLCGVRQQQQEAPQRGSRQ